MENEEKICQSCWTKTLDFHSFYTNIEYVQKQLYSSNSNLNDSEKINLEIKSIKLDIDDDDATLESRCIKNDQLADVTDNDGINNIEDKINNTTIKIYVLDSKRSNVSSHTNPDNNFKYYL